MMLPRALILALAMSAFTAGSVRSDDQTSLLTAMVRLQIALEQGVSFEKFSDFLLDAKTQVAMAARSTRPDVTAIVSKALDDADELRSLWAASLIPDCIAIHDCVSRVKSALQTLALVKSDGDMTEAIGLLAADNELHTRTEWNKLLQEGTAVTLQAVSSATQAMQ